MAANPLLDLDARLVIAHRGASAYAPENTIPAFELAVEQGADALEFDVRVTGDGVPVVLHDATTDRTTGVRLTLPDASLSRLLEADAGATFSPDNGRTFPWRGKGVRVPTLAQVLESIPQLPLLIEIKEPRGQEEVRRVLEAHRCDERSVVASADRRALAVFRNGLFALGAGRREIVRLYLGSWVGGAPRVASYQALSVPENYRSLTIPTAKFVSSARRLGCPVHVWTVDDPALARRLWRRRVSGIVTNVPDRLGAVRDSLRPGDDGPHGPGVRSATGTA
ncbi:MAG: glycerophosphodiester phosphodiesterase [Gemmatimonadales bacterium]|nr:glycerophosphodiester phosphodiesterase [Gemmatimonadales bacterium]